jgi:dynein heavy chain
VVLKWIDTFFGVSSVFKRIDSGEGHYIKELREHPEIITLLADVTRNLRTLKGDCEDYRHIYTEYQYLWTSDLSVIFAEFLETAFLVKEKPEGGEDDEEGEDDDEEELEDWQKEEPQLDLAKFDERIQYYLPSPTRSQGSAPRRTSASCASTLSRSSRRSQRG